MALPAPSWALGGIRSWRDRPWCFQGWSRAPSAALSPPPCPDPAELHLKAGQGHKIIFVPVLHLFSGAFYKTKYKNNHECEKLSSSGAGTPIPSIPEVLEVIRAPKSAPGCTREEENPSNISEVSPPGSQQSQTQEPNSTGREGNSHIPEKRCWITADYPKCQCPAARPPLILKKK